MITEWFTDPIAALDYGKVWLRGNTRSHILMGRATRGYCLIDPRNKDGHYCQIVAKLYRKQA